MAKIIFYREFKLLKASIMFSKASGNTFKDQYFYSEYNDKKSKHYVSIHQTLVSNNEIKVYGIIFFCFALTIAYRKS